MSNQPAIGDLLSRWSAGDQEAFRALAPLLYDDLRQIAHRHLRKARTDRTLQTTALVHELYLHLEKYPQSAFQNRAHFIAVCATAMWQILSRYERDRRAAKRGGGEDNLTLEDAGEMTRGQSIDHGQRAKDDHRPLQQRKKLQDFLYLSWGHTSRVVLDPSRHEFVALRVLIGNRHCVTNFAHR